MELKEFCGIHKKKIAIIALIAVAILILVLGVIFFLLSGKKSGSLLFGQGNFSMGGMSVSEGMVTASGITSVGVTGEKFEVEGLTEGLLVEEVYVSSGEKLEQGSKILKLSEESVATARTELEKALKSADLAYRAGVIEYEQNKITAEYDKNMAMLNGQYAQAVYEETISGLEDNVERARENLEETNEQIAEYREIVNSDDYYKTFRVGEYKALYEDNLKLLTTEMEKYGYTWDQVVSGGGAGGMSGGFVRSVSGSDAMGAPTGQLSVLQSLYKVLEQNLADYEQAQAEYEDAVANAQLNLQTLEYSVSSLKETLSQAQANYETRILQAKLTLEQTLASAERAESDYETALEKAESDYETLKEAKEDAEANLALFESSVGDGFYYAAKSGTILRVMLRSEQYMSSDSTIFVYNNPEEMTVTVSVAQEDIASIEVSEEAYVEAGEYGSYRGTVTEINPVSQSDSRTNVTYSVTVALTGNLGELPTNETVTVLFGIGGTDEKKN